MSGDAGDSPEEKAEVQAASQATLQVVSEEAPPQAREAEPKEKKKKKKKEKGAKGEKNAPNGKKHKQKEHKEKSLQNGNAKGKSSGREKKLRKKDAPQEDSDSVGDFSDGSDGSGGGSARDSDLASLENFCRENDLSEPSSEDHQAVDVADKDDHEQEGKPIDMAYVEAYLNSVSKKTRLSKVVKLLSMFRDALNMFVDDEVEDGMPGKGEVADEADQGEKQKKGSKGGKKRGSKRGTKGGDNRSKTKYSMDVDTSIFTVFNVLYNVDALFYNITNEGSRALRVWKLESIKNNEMYQEESSPHGGSTPQGDTTPQEGTTPQDCNLEGAKNAETPQSLHILQSMPNYKHLEKYKLLIVHFFKQLLARLQKLSNSDVCTGVIKILKKKNILRWIVILNMGKIFLKKICTMFILSKKNDVYFFLFLLIQNMVQLYNEKKKIIYNNSVGSLKHKEKEEIKKTYQLEKLLFEVYQNLMQRYLIHYGSNYQNVSLLNHMKFKENCLIELFTLLSHDVAYTITFRYIQTVMQKIREGFKVTYEDGKKGDLHTGDEQLKGRSHKAAKKKNTQAGKKKNAPKVNLIDFKTFHLHSSYMMLLLRFLIKIIKLCHNLDVLTYGLTVLIIAILKTKINNMKYIPVNLQLIHMLIRIMEDKKKYIPLFSYFTCILNGLKSYQHVRTISKNQQIRLTIEDFDINTSLEIDEKLISDFSIAHQVYEKVYVLLCDYVGLMVHHISFPEFFFAIDSFLKKYFSECKVHAFKMKIKNLLVLAKNSIEIIQKKRKNRNIYTMHDKMNFFGNDILPLSGHRLAVLESYENACLVKLKARISGLENIKHSSDGEDEEEDEEEDDREDDLGDDPEERPSKRCAKKRKREDQRAANRSGSKEDNNKKKKKSKKSEKGEKREKGEKNNNSSGSGNNDDGPTSAAEGPSREDKVEVFSMSSEDEREDAGADAKSE
ncbi:hypothetical protein PVNG_03463 [Plasmodium vivax North Korean]|uniref:Nucleolar complex protein 2 n=1 Tax=Plasmodium vivax North Korean TaxID=1035514 RepID=A0A0J9TU41_PLAVI|nr:hypothetical protein PVNG_03463 [Plasmodium vivax North Korean]